MGRFEDNEDDRKPQKSKGPHKDAKINFEEAHSSIEKYSIVSEDQLKIEMNCTSGDQEPLCVMFVFGPIGARIGTYVISFHQGNTEFRKELCTVFANLCKMGYLK